MRKQDVVKFFGGVNATAAAVGVTPGAVSRWGEDVPSPRVKTVELAMAAEIDRRKREEQKQRARERMQAKKAEQDGKMTARKNG